MSYIKKILSFANLLVMLSFSNHQIQSASNAQSMPDQEQFKEYLCKVFNFTWQHLDPESRSKFELINLGDKTPVGLLQALNKNRTTTLILADQTELILSHSIVRQFKLFLTVNKIAHASECQTCLNFLHFIFFKTVKENLNLSNEEAFHIGEQLLTTNPLVMTNKLLPSPSLQPHEILAITCKLFHSRFAFVNNEFIRNPKFPPYGLRNCNEDQIKLIADSYMNAIAKFNGIYDITKSKNCRQIVCSSTQLQSRGLAFDDITFEQIFESRVYDLVHELGDLRFDIILD